MDEIALRALLERAVEEEPPMGLLVSESLHAGKKLARRRRIEAAIGAVAAVALLAVVVSAAFAALRPGSRHRPAAPADAGITAFVWTTANAVTPIRLSTGTAFGRLHVPGQITNMASAPGGTDVYVFSFTATRCYVTRLDGSTGTASRPVRLAGCLYEEEVGIASGSSTAVGFGNWPVGSRNSAALIAANLTTGAERKLLTETGFMQPGAGTLTVLGHTAYTFTNDRVVAVNIITGRAGPLIRIQHGYPVNIAVEPGGTTAYVTSSPFGQPGKRTPIWITPINFSSGMAGTPIQVLVDRTAPWDYKIALSADGKTAYLYGGKTVIPVDLTTSQVLKPISVEVGNYIPTLAISPSDLTAYVSWWSRWLQPINMLTNTPDRELQLPGGYSESGPAAFSLNGDVLYVPAAFRGGTAVDAIIPVDTSTQATGRAIRVVGRPVQVVVIP